LDSPDEIEYEKTKGNQFYFFSKKWRQFPLFKTEFEPIKSRIFERVFQEISLKNELVLEAWRGGLCGTNKARVRDGKSLGW
jgi:hypothetical protein